jgi:hypothetical protein
MLRSTLLDDFGLAPMSEEVKRDLLEILDDRYDRRSTLITSQLPVDQWHAHLADPMLADAILDRLVHQQLSTRSLRSLDAKAKNRNQEIRRQPIILTAKIIRTKYRYRFTHRPGINRNAGPASLEYAFCNKDLPHRCVFAKDART